jgi:hypothetical protein
MSSYPHKAGGRLADYFVTVDLPEGFELTHREVFMRDFTSRYCPRDSQFAFEYDQARPLDSSYFPRGELCRITEEGIQ